MSENTITYDVDGYDIITTALCDLVNEYPGLASGDAITFSTLKEDGGKALFPLSGAVISSETRDILGGVRQICVYPFSVVYRASGLSESRRAAVKEWLDNLGRWLEKQKITIGTSAYQLTDYPALTDNRRFTQIVRQSPAFLESVADNAAEDWTITIYARYENNF